MVQEFFKFNKTNRAWHLPIVAGICVGIPLLLGFLFDNTHAGKLASLGTFIGLGLTWLILQFNVTTLGICLSILFLQIVVEFLVVRNYAVAAIFITTLTILLAEPNASLIGHPNHLIQARFFDILIGSVIGAIGGWMLFHERIHYFTKKQIVLTKAFMRKKPK